MVIQTNWISTCLLLSVKRVWPWHVKVFHSVGSCELDTKDNLVVGQSWMLHERYLLCHTYEWCLGVQFPNSHFQASSRPFTTSTEPPPERYQTSYGTPNNTSRGIWTTRITPAATFKHKGKREWVWVVTDMPQGYTLSLIIFSGVATSTRAKRI